MSNPNNPNNDIIVNNSPTSSISSLNFSPTSNLMVASCWSSDVFCWDVSPSGVAVAKAKTTHNAPVLCSAFHSDGFKVFSGGCDNLVKMWTLQTNQCQQIAQHAAPVKCCFYLPEPQMVVTGSWDKSVKYWDTRSPGSKADVAMPERVYCMDVKGSLIVIGTADRRILIYDLRKPTTAFNTLESPLKFQSRSIACFPDQLGFALGSIEGRIAISHVQKKDHPKNFTFRCHRDEQDVFAVNSISFNEQHGTFATCGADGGYAFWDKDLRQRLKLFNHAANSITCSTFNRDGTLFAYALSYDWSKGMEYYDQSKPNQIMLHAVQQAEVTKKKPTGR